MNQDTERRDPGARRVSVSTLVEVVGNVPGIPVFEAEALDVSARGMHLRTAYLPHEGDPLVCRFENAGREILVEGVVAWRREHSRGGEFGVQFTALDSKSVESLRELCGEIYAERPATGAQAGPIGSRVRLHIDGLGSPMKARVKEGSSARLQVGSSLEFLKLGRKLELEDIERGARREAQIDGVSVIVDPSTRIPQLVVALRFEGAEEVTPSPHHRDVAPVQKSTRRLDLPAENVTTDGPPAEAASRATPPKLPDSEAGADDGGADDPEMRGPVAQLAERAGERAKEAGAVLAQASSSAAKGALGLLQAAALRFGKARGTQRRVTSSKPATPPAKPRLRSQHAPNQTATVADLTKLPVTRKGVMLIGGAALLSAVGLWSSLRDGAEAEPAATAKAAERTVAPEPVSAVPLPGAAVTANVPLFGPTPLATTEPAPLAPGPGERAVEAAEKADAAALSPARVPDLEWAEEDGLSSSRDQKSERAEKSEASSDKDKHQTRPEDVTPWGRGKVREPTIHRLRLDAPGDALRGSAESTGFSVVVPSRKVMEAAAGIAKRDPRIARIRASNSAVGAQVSIQFKGPVPAYKVRLRKDYVELLISAPGTELANAPSSKPKSTGSAKPSP
jgi:hypothetical protein